MLIITYSYKMKSLKEVNSYTQIQLDDLLRISRQPDNTCPLIDALIYEGNRRSKIYDLEISYDPSHLSVDTSSLVERISQLESWSEDLLSKFEDIKKYILDKDELNILEDVVKEIYLKIKNNKQFEIEYLEKEINEIVGEWNSLYDSYEDENNDLNKALELVNELEYKISLEDSEDDDNNLDSLSAELEDAKYLVSQHEKSIDRLKSNFYINVERDFDSKIIEFSVLLESVRRNNDDMRAETISIRRHIMPILSQEFYLVQPLDHLKKIELGDDDEISVGVVDKIYFNRSVKKFSDYLKSNDVINEVQSKIFEKTSNINQIVDLLKEIGYKKIYYYESAKDFLDNPNNYKKIDLEYKNAKLLKPKI